jgi:Cys-rich protein (TIGR01571 family)
MARMHLNSCANPVMNSATQAKTKDVVGMSVAFLALHAILIGIWFFESSGWSIRWYQVTPLIVVDAILIVYGLILVYKTRRFVRNVYKIPGGYNKDCMATAFCPSCTIIQMGHHTADYDTYKSSWFSNTGLPPNVQALSPHSLPPPSARSPMTLC